MRRKPRRAASSPNTAAMCSQGSGVAAWTWSHARWAELSGQIAKSAPASASNRADSSITRATLA